MSTASSTTVASAAPPPPTSLLGRLLAAIRARSGVVKGVGVVVIVGTLFVMTRTLSVGQAIDALKVKADGLGFWAPFALGAGYVAAALMFLPGSALTLAAGAVFGLVWGTVTVSVASTIAAAIAFLIGRYVARERVMKQAHRYPTFRAIDDAIGAGGWKIVAMLRLSPAMPFSLGNYLFGLTAIRFWPYVFVSWLFMLPGTFLFVYLGHIGTEGLRSAAGTERGKSPAEWTLLGVGLLATVAVSAYITRLARKALH